MSDPEQAFEPAEHRLWMVTDRETARRYGSTLENCVERAVRAGVDAVLVRDKQRGADWVRRTGENLRELIGPGVPLVSSHHPQAAVEADMAGVQFGAADGDPAELVEKAPAELKVGFSCHSFEEVREREEQGYDWVFLGPVFPTPRKLKYGDPLDLQEVRRATGELDIPVVCIGGMNPETVPRASEAGARRVAAIRSFHRPDSPDLIPRMLQRLDPEQQHS